MAVIISGTGLIVIVISTSSRKSLLFILLAWYSTVVAQ